jgi:hypothetical protein
VTEIVRQMSQEGAADVSYDASLVHSGFAVQVNREGGDDHECNEYSS